MLTRIANKVSYQLWKINSRVVSRFFRNAKQLVKRTTAIKPHSETQCLERHNTTCRISFLSFIYLFAHRSWISPFHIFPKTSIKLFNLVRKQWLGLLHFSLRSACLSYFHTDKESIPRVCEGFTQDRLLAKISWNWLNSWEILNQRKSQIEQIFLMTWHSSSLHEALKTRKFPTVYVGMISIPHWE